MAPAVVAPAPHSAELAFHEKKLPAAAAAEATVTFSEPDATELPLRSKHYLSDRLKQPSQPAAFRLLNVDVFQNSRKGRYDRYASHPDTYLARLRASGEHVPFVIMLHFQSTRYNLAVTWAVDDRQLDANSEFARLWAQFVNGTDDFRNGRFKVIPRIVEGSWMLRKACGQTRPVLLATKLTHTYEHTEHYLLIKCDTTSSKLASNLADLSIGCASSLTIDMACVVEGRSEDELPERVFGTFRLVRPDLKNCRTLNVDL